MSNHRRTDHVGDEFVFLSVPGKQRWAGASTAIQFRDGKRRLGSYFRFVLRNTRGPQHSHHVGVLRTSDSGEKLLRPLAEIAGGSRNLELLPDAISKDFDLGANS